MAKTNWYDPKQGPQSRALFESLVEADTEDEIVKILRDAGLWDDPKSWRLYGDQPDNFSAAGAQQNNPEAALVEKAINSVDASLMGRALAAGIDPRAATAPQTPREAVATLYEGATPGSIPESMGIMANWTSSKRTEVARDITIALTGPRNRKPSVSIADVGEGQPPERLPTTILSLLHGNKKSIPFVQGKFNMGGTGALRFCGYHNLQLVISRRRPEISSQEGSSSSWGFSVVRRDNPDETTRVSTYRFLAPVGADANERQGEVLRFDAAEVKIFPAGQKPYDRPAKWGTLIKLYEYDTRNDSNFFMKSGLLHRLDIMMPGLILPIRLHECRAFKGVQGSFETTLTGLEVRLRAQESSEKEGNLEPSYPDSGTITVDGETIKYTIYAFRRKLQESYKTNEGVLFVVNGQTHAILTDAFFSRTSVGLGSLAKSLLVVLDCSDMQPRTREDLFMNSRDRLANARLAHRIEAELADSLRRHKGLEDLKNRRRQEDLASRIGDSKPVEEMLRNMIKRSPALARLFFPGSKLSNPFATVNVPVAKAFIGKPHPTYVRFRDRQQGEELTRDAHLGQRARLSLETDVANDYFRRAARSGHLTVLGTISASQVALTHSANLYDGLFSLNIELPSVAKVGDILDLEITVSDETLIDPFVNIAHLNILPEATKSPSPGGPRPPHPDKGDDGSTEKRPAGIDIPEPFPVYRDTWDEHSGFTMDRYSAMRAVQSSASSTINVGAYDFYINMDNDYLLAEQKSHLKNADMIRHQYKFGMTLTAIAAIKYLQQGHHKNSAAGGDNPEGSVWTPESIVEAVTDTMAPALLPMIDILGELDEEDIAQPPNPSEDLDEAEPAIE